MSGIYPSSEAFPPPLLSRRNTSDRIPCTPTMRPIKISFRTAMVSAPADPILHVRPIPQMSGFPSVTWDGWEKYNALTLTFTQRVWRGLTVNSNYTWSKALDDASNPGADNAGPNFPQDPTNMAAEKGLSDFDHRHRFVTSFPVSDSVPEEFRRLDSHGVRRLAGGRNLDAGKRRALYRESLDRTSPITESRRPRHRNGRIWLAIRTAGQKRRRNGSTPPALRCPLHSPMATRDVTL